MSAGAHRCGQMDGILIEVAGIRIYHLGSSNVIDDAVPRGGVELFLAGSRAVVSPTATGSDCCRCCSRT